MYDQNNRIIQRLNKAADLVILSFMWVLSCLPVITIGTACASAYDTVIKSIRQDSGRMMNTYWQALGKNWKRTWLATLGTGALAAGFSFIIVKLWPIRQQFLGGIYFFMSCFFALTAVLYALHLFCLLGRFTMSPGTLARVALWVTFTRPLYNLLLAFVLLGSVWMFLTYPPLILAIPGMFFWFMTYLEEPAFHRFLEYPDDLKDPDGKE